MTTNDAVIELSTIVAGIIQRAGASYGSPEDWRTDMQRCVNIYQQLLDAQAKGAL